MGDACSVRVCASFALYAFIILLVLGCGTRVNSDYLQYAQLSYDASEFNRLGVDDRFEIRVYREDAMSSTYTVTQQGTINFPLIGTVNVIDRTCAEIEAEVAERLGATFLRDPAVSCRVVDLNSLRFIVSGEVRSPGRFSYTDSVTVVEAIAMAGGVSDNAHSDRVVVTRTIDGTAREITIPYRSIISGRAPNFRLWPNDIVTVPTYRLIQ